MGVLMHRCMPLLYGNASNYLKDLLLEVSHVQQCFTRASNDFHVPVVVLYMGSLLYNGSRLLNTLQRTLNVLPELSIFKYSV